MSDLTELAKGLATQIPLVIKGEGSKKMAAIIIDLIETVESRDKTIDRLQAELKALKLDYALQDIELSHAQMHLEQCEASLKDRESELDKVRGENKRLKASIEMDRLIDGGQP